MSTAHVTIHIKVSRLALLRLRFRLWLLRIRIKWARLMLWLRP